MTKLTVVSTNLELPKGARFTYRPRLPIETGALCLLSIGNLLTIGRYYRDIAGFDWIVQPGLLIQIVGKVVVKIWGLVVPLGPAVNPDWNPRSSLLVAGATIIEIWGLLA